MVNNRTPLSELRRQLDGRVQNVSEYRERLARSVEQSMRVEGYQVSHADALAAIDRVMLLLKR